ncbi:hypothetical protein GOP47_0028512 [Adiantum capillus-veneris]|nr:hypothetical protein GOP47_0028512 [Adiantum capillus-veneris]
MTLGWRACMAIPHGLLLVFICVTSAAASTPGLNLRGVSPQDVSYYKSGHLLWCRDGSKRFSLARLNDDFCDCPDGTDEPGTSACPNGRFYCTNQKQAPRWVFASRVNDGICDCCDGSDEYNGKMQCKPVCNEEGGDASIQVLPTKAAREVIVTDSRKSFLSEHESEPLDASSKSYFLGILEVLELLLVMLALWQFYSWTFRGGFALRRRLPR